jgi:hypothetical protein
MLTRIQNETALYDQYQQGLFSKERLESILSEQILSNSVYYTGCYGSLSDFSDFVAWFYPRLSKAIDRYQKLGATFATYLRSMIRHAYREFRMRQKDHALTEEAVWTEKALEGTAESALLYPTEDDAQAAAYLPVTNPRQVLILLLKSYHFLTQPFIERVAPALGMDAEALTVMINKLRELRKKRDGQVHELRERVYAQYYRCLSFRRRAEEAAAGSSRREHWEGCLDRGTKRLESMRKKLRHCRVNAKNSEVAHVLGMTKGGVDATLYFIRKRYGLLDEAPPNVIPPVSSTGKSRPV